MNPRLSKAGNFLLATTVVAIIAFALVRVVGAQGPHTRVSMISDWSHRHVVFSQPTTWATAWRLQGEARYWQQTIRRGRRGPDREESEFERGRFGFRGFGPGGFGWREHPREQPIERDWGMSLGALGSVGAPLVLSPAPNWWPVYPAKFSFDVNAAPDCTNDYVVFTTNLAGATGGQASIVAYNKLYSGSVFSFCALALAPSVYWSYNTNFTGTGAGTATTGTVASSPVLSIDGSKLAFVESRTNANGGSILHLLKWKAGDGGAINTAAAPTNATVWTADGAAGHCPTTGACMINLVFDGAQAVTGSSPFYDYHRDTLYVGDDAGVLHKFVNVFGLGAATPSEVTTGNWPITVRTGTILTSPILDGVSGNLFTGDSGGHLSYIRETFSTAGACTGVTVVPCLGSSVINPAGHVIPDAPIVDSTTEKVFVFFGNDGAGTSVIQSDVTLSATVRVGLGTGTAHHLHSGAFDNAYLTGNGSAGRLYMCGSSATSTPTLQRIGFTNTGRAPASPFANPVGTMNAALDAATLTVATASAECAPVTEFFNPNAPAASQDQIFFGVQTSGSGANCGGGGCVMSVNVTGIPGSLAIFNSIEEVGGPSGIIVDNDANTNTGNFPQASSLYFSNQGNSTAAIQCGTTTGVGCAIKVTQAALN